MILPASETRKIAREALQGKWGKSALIILIYLAIFLVTGILSAIPFLGFLVMIGEFVIMIPIAFGLSMTFLKLKRGQEVGYVDFLTDGFKNFSRAWCVTGRLLLKMIVPIILYIVGFVIMTISAVSSLVGAVSLSSSVTGTSLVFMFISIILIAVAAGFFIVLGLKYALSVYIAIDNPDMPAADCVNKSGELMDGNSGKLFCLTLSFIGWFLLASILPAIFSAIGIDFLYTLAFLAAEVFLLPYIYMAIVVFYENIAEISNSSTVETAGNVTTEENTNGIQEKSGSQDVRAEIVDIPELEKKPNEDNNE